MKVEIKNYRGIASAELSMEPIALVAGVNGAGKSSIAQGIAAALTKNAAPIAGIAKNAAGKLLRDGAKRGSCTVGDDTGRVTANWPGASVSDEGTPPWSTEMACGLVSLVDMKPKDAASLLIRAIEAAPTFEHLKEALPKVDAAMLQSVWGVIQADGWDAAHKRSQERGAKLKGGWEHVTGEKYGSSKAEGWTHPRLSGQDVTLADLQQENADLHSELERAIQNQAGDAAQIEMYRQQVERSDEARKEFTTIDAQQKQLRDQINRLQAELDALPKPEAAETMVECPHCKGHLVVVSSTQVRAPTKGLSQEENDSRSRAIESKRSELSSAQHNLRETDSRSHQLLAVIRAGENAANALEEQKSGTVTHETIADLRSQIGETEQDMRALSAAEQAAKYHAQVKENQLVIDALAPDGIRNKVLAEKMGNFNSALRQMSEAAGWPAVQIADDLSVTLGDRPYILLSESEKFRVRTTLQVALADLDGSDVVIVDAADILDRTGRNGLFKLLNLSGMRAVVCMTMNQEADVPDLSKAGFGRSYWLTDNTLAPAGA